MCEKLGHPRGVHLSCQDCCNACNRDIVAQQGPVASNSVMGQSVQEGRPHVAPAKRRFGVRFKERRSLKSARIRSRATETTTMTPQERLSLPWLTKILGLQNSWIVQGAVIKQQGLTLPFLRGSSTWNLLRCFIDLTQSQDHRHSPLVNLLSPLLLNPPTLPVPITFDSRPILALIFFSKNALALLSFASLLTLIFDDRLTSSSFFLFDFSLYYLPGTHSLFRPLSSAGALFPSSLSPSFHLLLLFHLLSYSFILLLREGAPQKCPQ